MEFRLRRVCFAPIHHFQVCSLFCTKPTKQKLAMKVAYRKSKYYIWKYYSVSSVEKFRCSLYNEWRQPIKNLGQWNQWELNYCISRLYGIKQTVLVSISCRYRPIVCHPKNTIPVLPTFAKPILFTRTWSDSTRQQHDRSRKLFSVSIFAFLLDTFSLLWQNPAKLNTHQKSKGSLSS